MNRKLVPSVVKPQSVAALGSEASVRDAAKLMAERRIGAIVVIDGGRLSGIFTERDLMTRVVAQDRDPTKTRIGEVMTRGPDTMAPDDTAGEALKLMSERRYRHLPIVDGERIVAILSIRDLHEAVLSSLEEDVRQRDQLIFGSAHGLA
ncbi:MAG: CBS domain-containing protein [Alphaproteobacteria bacterium]|nr:CBS domain-containing protein [Alphaproteobacteria bacterium]